MNYSLKTSDEDIFENTFQENRHVFRHAVQNDFWYEQFVASKDLDVIKFYRSKNNIFSHA